MKLKELRRELKYKVEKYDGDCCVADITLILMKVLNLSKTQVLIGDRDISEKEEKLIFGYFERLMDGEPVQYIVNGCEFMSLPFYIEKGVLIPRADTEVLVEEVIKRLGKKDASVADLCCGSGCIGISIARYTHKAKLKFFDFADKAIELTKKNANALIKERDYSVTKMNLLLDFPQEYFDCVVSNPPYIETYVVDKLERKVRCYEPCEALDGGSDGLDFYRRIASKARINEGGFIAFEVGYNQGKAVKKILENNGFKEIEVICDLENRDRVVIGKKLLQ